MKSNAGLLLRLRIVELQRQRDKAVLLVLQSRTLSAQGQAVALPLHALTQTHRNSEPAP